MYNCLHNAWKVKFEFWNVPVRISAKNNLSNSVTHRELSKTIALKSPLPEIKFTFQGATVASGPHWMLSKIFVEGMVSLKKKWVSGMCGEIWNLGKVDK